MYHFALFLGWTALVGLPWLIPIPMLIARSPFSARSEFQAAIRACISVALFKASTAPRGKAGKPQKVSLPEGFLAKRDDSTPLGTEPLGPLSGG